MKVCPVCEGEWPDDTKFCPDDGSALRSGSKSRDLIGTLIAERYQVIDKLGEGGMGAVYLAEHVKMGLKVAIKVLPTALADDVGSVARFNREAKNAARIKHPNACAIHDFGETPEGLVYLAMEYVEGETLTQLLQREGAVSATRAASILLQCCDALRSAHDLGIVHRDLKPDNIMVTRTRDGGDFVKVVDFGIAKAVMDDEGQTLTQSGFLVGTPEYMSPEQVSGDVLDGRSDVYSLALVLFRMLTGSTPFKANTPQESFAKRLAGSPLKLVEVAPGVEFPSGLQALMDRALAMSRDNRYSDVMEFGRAASGVLQGMPDAIPSVNTDAPTHLIPSGEEAETRTPETPQPIPQPAHASKRRLPIAVLSAVAVVIGGAAIVAMVIRGGPEGEASPPMSTADVADSAARDTTVAFAQGEDEAQDPTDQRDADTALKAQYLRDLAIAVERDEGVRDASARLDEAYPSDAALHYQATLLLIQGGYGSWALADFGTILDLDPSYVDSQPIFVLASAYLDSTWYSSTTHEAREFFGRYLCAEHCPELIGNLESALGNRRLNSYEILRTHAADDLATTDIFPFHVLNLTSAQNYRNQGTAFGWAVDYFTLLNDESLVQRAIIALEESRTNPHVMRASGLMSDVAETIELLRSATIAIRVVHWGEQPTAPTRYGYEFQFDWMDETEAGSRDYAESVTITLTVDGEVVADRANLMSVSELAEAATCARLGSTLRDPQTNEPRQCSFEIRWRYHHPPLAPGEHHWTFRATYVDSEDGNDSFEEQYSGSFTTIRGIESSP